MNLKLHSYEIDMNILFGALLAHIFIISYMYFICRLTPRKNKREKMTCQGRHNLRALITRLGALREVSQALGFFEHYCSRGAIFGRKHSFS
jgi:hypothetical protein